MTVSTGVTRPGEAAALRDLHVVSLFALVADRTRLTLLRFLLREEHCVTQCARHLGLTHSAASKQLTALADGGLLTARRSGRRTYYVVSDAEALGRLIGACDALLPARPPRPAT